MSNLHVIGMGAASSIGGTVWTNAAAARAGRCGFREHPLMVDSIGGPMRVAAMPGLDPILGGADRLQALLFPVIDEALLPVAAHIDTLRLGLLLALPPVRPGQPAEVTDAICQAMRTRYGALFDPVVPFPRGHAAGHLALAEAERLLTSGAVRGCLVAGVDSYMAPETLEWVEACDQMHGAGAQNNAWGFVPGEAAGALLLAGRGTAARAADVYAVVEGLGIATETKLIKTDDVCIGAGLTEAFRAALSSLSPGVSVDAIVCDQNGDKYRADEYGFASLRTKDRFRSIGDFQAPADCWGDIGAAGALLHVTLAAIGHRKRYAKGPRTLVSASSEDGARGALVLRALDRKAV